MFGSIGVVYAVLTFIQSRAQRLEFFQRDADEAAHRWSEVIHEPWAKLIYLFQLHAFVWLHKLVELHLYSERVSFAGIVLYLIYCSILTVE